MDTLLSSLCLSSLCLSSLCLFSLCLSSLSSLLLSSSLSSSSLLSELLSSLLASLPSSVGDCACSGSLGVCLFRTYSSSTRIFHHKPLGVSDLLVTWLSSSNSCKMDPQRWTLLWMVQRTTVRWQYLGQYIFLWFCVYAKKTLLPSTTIISCRLPPIVFLGLLVGVASGQRNILIPFCGIWLRTDTVNQLHV